MAGLPLETSPGLLCLQESWEWDWRRVPRYLPVRQAGRGVAACTCRLGTWPYSQWSGG